MRWRRKVREAIAYKQRGYLDLAQEILENIPSRARDSLSLFHLAEVYMEIAKRKKAELSPLHYRAQLEKAMDVFKKCIQKDKGELYRFVDRRGNVEYHTLSELSERRIKQLNKELEALEGIKEEEKVERVAPLQWSSGSLLVIKPSKKESKK